MRVVCLGAHILDVLGRPVTDIPAGQGRRVLDEIRLTAAGTAGGTAVDLAKLGAEVVGIGAVGDDGAGRMLRSLLTDHGVDASRLVVRPGGATPSTILPIRPDGSRPALHAPGVMATLTADDVDPDLVARADVLHVGGPDVLGGFATADLPGILRHAVAHGTTVSMDLLSVGRAGLLDELGALWEHVDWFLPNDDQLRALTGRHDLEDAAGELRAAGVGGVVVTCGADGALLVDGAVERVPALAVDVVDTTGCGDAFCAGFLVGLDRGLAPPGAARLGTATAALVAGGLGSDAGIADLDTTLAFLAEHGGRGVPV
ncbi:carbohydrate kinase family protein [Actinomycetospora sp. NBRC 106378]|uniref:carbohydrate kinase family protein n=1 Tax=Actinomycetospora sp. NBRC 106378 TaxID=3032208 RepID=UPI0024A22194|nr:carbohydrate kinase family protein [Actinomycetospora sp. NBRC 106378]GLZ51627.1 sugar kinase [Actinomycetospora sp. NBRC 106378]